MAISRSLTKRRRSSGDARSEIVMSNHPEPRSTLVKRYNRLYLKGFSAVVCFVLVCALSLFLLAETFSGPPPRFEGMDRSQAEDLLVRHVLRAVVDGLRAGGLSDTSIRLGLLVVCGISVAGIGLVIHVVRRSAPP